MSSKRRQTMCNPIARDDRANPLVTSTHSAGSLLVAMLVAMALMA
jgi:hypothetical protein